MNLEFNLFFSNITSICLKVANEKHSSINDYTRIQKINLLGKMTGMRNMKIIKIVIQLS